MTLRVAAAGLPVATAHERLTRLEFLTPDHTVRRAAYGETNPKTVVVNFGTRAASVECDPKINWRGRTVEVCCEQIITPGRDA